MSKNQKIFGVFTLFLVIFFTCLSGKAASAADNRTVGFLVTPKYSDTQKKESSFFDLLVAPGSQQTIGVTVTNTSQEAGAYHLQVVQASTNKNGIIDYSDPKGQFSAALPLDLTKQASYEKEIQLSPNESKLVPIQLKIPATPFKGEALGGVNVTKEIPKNKKQSQLVNQYSYVLGLRLREGAENAERALSAGKAKPEVSFGKTGVSVAISNDRANAMGHLQVDSILKKDGQEITQATYKEREIAPNSTYPYTLSWEKKDYQPGKYQLNITIKDAQAHTWTFKNAFVLSTEEVKKVKEQAIQPQAAQNNWIWLIVAIGVLIILGLILYIIKMKRDNSAGRGSK